MEYLSNYIKYMTTNIYDGHIHLFSHRGAIMDNKGFNIPSQYDKVIGFMDIEFNDLDKYSHNDVIKYYDNFIENYYDPSKMILLATGIDSKTAHDIFALAKKLGNRSFSLKAKRFVKAYTKTERVLQDDYDPAFVSPDYNLVNDESVNDSIDFHDELTNDGEEDFDALEQDKRQLSNDGFVFI